MSSTFPPLSKPFEISLNLYSDSCLLSVPYLCFFCPCYGCKASEHIMGRSSKSSFKRLSEKKPSDSARSALVVKVHSKTFVSLISSQISFLQTVGWNVTWMKAKFYWHWVEDFKCFYIWIFCWNTYMHTCISLYLYK